MSASKYVYEAVTNAEKQLLQKSALGLTKRTLIRLLYNYNAELDNAKEFDALGANYCQLKIEIPYWMVKLGRDDIITKVLVLSFHLVMLSEGHMDAVLHIFVHLKHKHNARIVF